MKLFCFSWKGPLTSAQAIVCDESLVKAKETLFLFLKKENYSLELNESQKETDSVSMWITSGQDVTTPGVIAYEDGGD